MKTTKKILVVCLFILVSKLEARHIIDVHKQGGLFNGYWTVTQTYLGTADGNEWWYLDCRWPGFARCKLIYSTWRTGTSPREDEIADAEVANTANAFDFADDQIENKNTPSGSVTKHYHVTLSDNSTVDIYVELTWSPDPDSEGDYIVHTETYHS